MTTFDKREASFEGKFVRDEELRFRATARRNKLLGLWAAAKLGKTGDDAQAYAREVIRSDMQEAGDEDVLRKVRADLEAGGLPVSDRDVRQQMETLMLDAIAEIEAGR